MWSTTHVLWRKRLSDLTTEHTNSNDSAILNLRTQEHIPQMLCNMHENNLKQIHPAHPQDLLRSIVHSIQSLSALYLVKDPRTTKHQVHLIVTIPIQKSTCACLHR